MQWVKVHTSGLGMERAICNNTLTVAGEITRSTDSIISKYPMVALALSDIERSIVQGARICNGIIIIISDQWS